MTVSPDALADSIAADITERRPFRPWVETIGDDLDLAYRVQALVVARLLGQRPGRTIAGYKIAFNRPSSLQYYRLREPCVAPIFSDLIRPDGAVLRLVDYHGLVVEPELVLTLSRDVPADASMDALAQAVASIRPGFELMDPRGALDLDPSAAAAVAQDIYNVGAVLGTNRDEGEPAGTSLLVGGAVIHQGGAPQPPLEALASVARVLARQGITLKAGMIVLCGTHTPALPILVRGRVEMIVGGIGRAALEVV